MMNFSFAGGGFLGIYHVGVSACLQEYIPNIIKPRSGYPGVLCGGASAGSLSAAGLICEADLGQCTSFVLKIASQARSRALGPLHPSFNVDKILREGFDEFLPANAHELCTGRLHVSMTRLSDRKNVIASQFDTREDLIQALICSSFVPFYCGLFPPKYKGEYYIDGGVTVNIPILDENTITVSPFCGESDICPIDNSSNDMHLYVADTSLQFTLANFYRCSYAFFPPHPEVLASLCKQGFDDALRFLQKNNLINCVRHLNVESQVVATAPLSSPSAPHSQADDVEEMCVDEEEMDYDGDGDGDFCHDYDDPTHSCNDCKHRRHLLAVTGLPPAVVTSLQSAIEIVNGGGYMASVQNMMAYKALSLVVAPWMLPLDLTLEICTRVLARMPKLHDRFSGFTDELAMLIDDLMYFVHHGKHKYSARLSCQLAVTELDYNQDGVILDQTTSALPSIAHSSPSMNRKRHKEHYTPSRRRKLNAEFVANFGTHEHSPLRLVEDLRQMASKSVQNSRANTPFHSRGPSRAVSRAGSRAVSRAASPTGSRDGSPIRSRTSSLGQKPRKAANGSSFGILKPHMSPFTGRKRCKSIGEDYLAGNKDSRRSSFNDDFMDADLLTNFTDKTEINDVVVSEIENDVASIDALESALGMASQSQSVLSFYYNDEDNPNSTHVTEIFPLSNSSVNPLDHAETSLNNWNDYIKRKPSVLNLSNAADCNGGLQWDTEGSFQRHHSNDGSFHSSGFDNDSTLT